MNQDEIALKIEEMFPETIEWRRYLHERPELSFEEHQTSQYIVDRLSEMDGLEISRPTKTSVIAKLKGSFPGKTTALRADIDALPIHEETDLPFASQREGVMHACAHDGHTASLLGAVKVLTSLKEQLHGDILFIFQHAEELPPGGAQEMVAAGVLEGVDQVLGLHLMSTLPLGTIGVRHDAITAASDLFEITIQGKGGHSSQPEMTVDPLSIGAQMVSALNHIVSRRVGPLESAVVSVTKFHGGGEALNVIPDRVEIGGSVRTLDQDVREKVRHAIEQVMEGLAAANGATATLKYTYGYDSVVNDQYVTQQVADTVATYIPEEAIEWIDPMLGGEDFSAFSNEVPSCYVLIGAKNEEKGIVHPHHHPKFDIDEAAMLAALKFHVYCALTMNEGK